MDVQLSKERLQLRLDRLRDANVPFVDFLRGWLGTSSNDRVSASKYRVVDMWNADVRDK